MNVKGVKASPTPVTMDATKSVGSLPVLNKYMIEIVVTGVRIKNTSVLDETDMKDSVIKSGVSTLNETEIAYDRIVMASVAMTVTE